MRISRPTILALASCLLIACGGGDDPADDQPPGDDVPPDPPTSVRLNTMEVRDPHFFAFGGIDVTSQVNDAIADGITMDASEPPDGRLDLNFLIVFRPWAPGEGDAPVDAVAGANCTAPVGTTTCTPDPAATVINSTASNGDSTCLAPASGTTGDYQPPVTTPTGRCFSTDQHDLNLTLGSITLMLQDTQIAGTYSATGHSLSNGLMIGFITQATADATILPADLPVVGGMPLSALLLPEDRDTGPGGDGWWFYINFTASEVTYTE